MLQHIGIISLFYLLYVYNLSYNRKLCALFFIKQKNKDKTTTCNKCKLLTTLRIVLFEYVCFVHTIKV